MPHIVIKTISGKPQAQLQKAAEQAAAAVSQALGKPEKYLSVAVEEYTAQEWEGVFNECIRDNENVLVKPGYSDPVTFT